MNLRRLNEEMDEILKQPITLSEISEQKNLFSCCSLKETENENAIDESVINISLVTEKLYNKLVNVLYGNNRVKNRNYEQQQNVLNFLQEIEDRIPLQWGISVDLADYGFTADEINAIKKIVREERVAESYKNDKLNYKAEDFIVYYKLSEYMTELGFETDWLPEDCTIEKLITWIFEHNDRAYEKSFWVDTFDLTDEQLIKYGIMKDLNDEQDFSQALQNIVEADDEGELITSEDIEAQIDNAIKKYIEKHGNEIKLEADYDDELTKEQIIQIFNSKNPTEKFIEIIDEWDWWEMSDSSYEYIIDNLDISDDIRKEYRGEIFNKITNDITYSIPYDHYNIEVGFDIYLQNPNDHAERDTIIWNEQDGEEIITQLDETIEKLIELQGYNVLDFEKYYQAKKNEKEIQENKFFDDLIEEIENCTYNYGNEIVVLAQAKILDMANAIIDKKQITIPLDATCGLHNAANGSGSLLAIELEKDLNLTIGKDCEVFYKDGYRYNIDETHGLVYGAWQTDVQIPVSEN